MSENFASKLLDKPEVDTFQRYSAKFSLSGSDENWFRKMSMGSQHFPKGSQVARQGQEDSGAHLLVSGWAYTATDHGDGSRTVFDLHLPGDLIICPGVLTVPRRTSLLALSDCQISTLNVTEMLEGNEHSPNNSNFMAHLMGHQLDVLADRVIQTTRMSAITRISLFYLSLLQRLREISPSITNQFFSPVTQNLLSEILGMSEVHVSRTMISLRSLDVLVVTNRVVEYKNIEKLEQLSRMSSGIDVTV